MEEIQHAYPIFLDLHGQACLVVGAGRVAERRVRRLIDSGARVTIVAPQATRVIHKLHERGDLTYIARPYQSGDLAGHALALLTTDDEGVHEQVYQDRLDEGLPILINDAMRPARSDFTVPALHREGALSVAVSTGGLMPRLAAAVSSEVGRLFGQTGAALLRRYRTWKTAVMVRRRSGAEAVRALRRAVDTHLLDAFRSGDLARIAATLERADKVSPLEARRARLPGAPPPRPGPAQSGTVYLVGAGPGDPGLITIKGREVLGRAGAVVYDRLIDAAVLELAPPWAETVPVGKAAGRNKMSQEAINQRLKDLAGSHEVVVRLKGGDPFVLGRGGEEAEFLQAESIPFEVVPGVTAAVAVPAYAGIPLTHRSWASSVAVVTAHPVCADGAPRPIAVPEADTLVYLMGLANLPAVVEALRSEGKAPDTPVAVVSMGTTVRQQVVTAPLEAIVEEVRQAGPRPPAVIVVGEVARFAERLGWFHHGGAEAFPVDEAPPAREGATPKSTESARAG
jgi:uroporphyrin-III C-methyltransferase/precorrin-2 dehydrogenase/sirohydrochlorin ferrochelatase